MCHCHISHQMGSWPQAGARFRTSLPLLTLCTTCLLGSATKPDHIQLKRKVHFSCSRKIKNIHHISVDDNCKHNMQLENLLADIYMRLHTCAYTNRCLQLWCARPAASGTVLQVIPLEAVFRSAQAGSPHPQTTKSQAKSASTQVLRLGNPKVSLACCTPVQKKSASQVLAALAMP